MKDIIRFNNNPSYNGLDRATADGLVKSLSENNKDKDVQYIVQKISQDAEFGGMNVLGSNNVQIDNELAYMVVGMSSDRGYLESNPNFSNKTLGFIGTANGNVALMNASVRYDNVLGDIVEPGYVLNQEFRPSDLGVDYLGHNSNIITKHDGSRKLTMFNMHKVEGIDIVSDANVGKNIEFLNKAVKESIYGFDSRISLQNLKDVASENTYTETHLLMSDFLMANKINTYNGLDSDAIRDGKKVSIKGGVDFVEKLFNGFYGFDEFEMVSGEESALKTAINENFMAYKDDKKMSGKTLRNFFDNEEVKGMISYFGVDYSSDRSSVESVYAIDKNGNRVNFNKRLFNDFYSFNNSISDSYYKFNDKSSGFANLIGHSNMTEGDKAFVKLNTAMASEEFEEKKRVVREVLGAAESRLVEGSGYKSYDDMLSYVERVKRQDMLDFYNNNETEFAGAIDSYFKNRGVNASATQIEKARSYARDIFMTGEASSSVYNTHVDADTRREIYSFVKNKMNSIEYSTGDVFERVEKIQQIRGSYGDVLGRVEMGATFHTANYIGKQSSLKGGKLGTVDAKMIHLLGHTDLQGHRHDQGADILEEATAKGVNLGAITANLEADMSPNLDYKRGMFSYDQRKAYVNLAASSMGINSNVSENFMNRYGMVLYADTAATYQDSSMVSTMSALSNIGSFGEESMEIGIDSLTSAAIEKIKEADEGAYLKLVSGKELEGREKRAVINVLLGSGRASKYSDGDSLAVSMNAIAEDLRGSNGTYQERVAEYGRRMSREMEKRLIVADETGAANIFDERMIHDSSSNTVKGGNFVSLDNIDIKDGRIKVGFRTLLAQQEGSKINIGGVKATTGTIKNLIEYVDETGISKQIDVVTNNNMLSEKRGFFGEFLSGSMHTMFYHASRNSSGEYDMNGFNKFLGKLEEEEYQIQFQGGKVKILDLLNLGVSANKDGKIVFNDRNVQKALDAFSNQNDILMHNPFHALHESMNINLRAKLGVSHIGSEDSEYLGKALIANLYGAYDDFLNTNFTTQEERNSRTIALKGGGLRVTGSDGVTMIDGPGVQGNSFALIKNISIMNESRNDKEYGALRIGRLTTNVISEQGAHALGDLINSKIDEDNLRRHTIIKGIARAGEFDRTKDAAAFNSLFKDTFSLDGVERVYNSSGNADEWLKNSPLGAFYRMDSKTNQLKGEVTALLGGLNPEIAKNFSNIANKFSDYDSALLASPVLNAINQLYYRGNEIGESVDTIIDSADSTFRDMDLKKNMVRQMLKQATIFMDNFDSTSIKAFDNSGDGISTVVNQNYLAYMREFKKEAANVNFASEEGIYKRSLIYSKILEGNKDVEVFNKHFAKSNTLEIIESLENNEVLFKQIFGTDFSAGVEDYGIAMEKLAEGKSNVASYINVQKNLGKRMNEIYQNGEFLTESFLKQGFGVMKTRAGVVQYLAKNHGLVSLGNYIDGVDINDVFALTKDIFEGENEIVGSGIRNLMTGLEAISGLTGDTEAVNAAKTLIGISSELYRGNGGNLKGVVDFGKFGNIPFHLMNQSIDAQGNLIYNAQLDNVERIMKAQFDISGAMNTMNVIDRNTALNEDVFQNDLKNSLDQSLRQLEGKSGQFRKNLSQIRLHLDTMSESIFLSSNDIKGMRTFEKGTVIRASKNNNLTHEIVEKVKGNENLSLGKSRSKMLSDVNIKEGSTVFFFDTETTSTDIKKAEINQIAGRQYKYTNGKWQFVEGSEIEYYYDVNRERSGAKEVTGIDSERVRAHRNANASAYLGVSEQFEDDAERVARKMVESDYIVGYNSENYDIPLINRYVGDEDLRILLKNKSVDAMVGATETYSNMLHPFKHGEHSNLKLTEAYLLTGNANSSLVDTAHDAMSDIKMTAGVFFDVHAKNIRETNEFTFDDIMQSIKYLEAKAQASIETDPSSYSVAKRQLDVLNGIINNAVETTITANGNAVNANLIEALKNGNLTEEQANLYANAIESLQKNGVKISKSEATSLRGFSEKTVKNSSLQISKAIAGYGKVYGDAMNKGGIIQEMSDTVLKNSKSVSPTDASGLISAAKTRFKDVNAENIGEFQKAFNTIWGHDLDERFLKFDESGSITQDAVDSFDAYVDKLMGVVLSKKTINSKNLEAGAQYVFGSRHPMQYLNSFTGFRQVVLGDEDNVSFIKDFLGNASGTILEREGAMAYVGRLTSAALNMDFDGDKAQIFTPSLEDFSDSYKVDFAKSEAKFMYDLNNWISTVESDTSLSDDFKRESYNKIKNNYIDVLNTYGELGDERQKKAAGRAIRNIDNRKNFLRYDLKRMSGAVNKAARAHSQIIALGGLSDNVTFNKQLIHGTVDYRKSIINGAIGMNSEAGKGFVSEVIQAAKAAEYYEIEEVANAYLESLETGDQNLIFKNSQDLVNSISNRATRGLSEEGKGALKIGNLDLSANLYKSYAGQARTGLVHDALSRYREGVQIILDDHGFGLYKNKLLKNAKVISDKTKGANHAIVTKGLGVLDDLVDVLESVYGFNGFTDNIEAVISSKLSSGQIDDNKIVKLYNELSKSSTAINVKEGVVERKEGLKKLISLLSEKPGDKEMKDVIDLVDSGTGFNIESLANLLVGNKNKKLNEEVRKVLAFEIFGEFHDTIGEYTEFSRNISGAVVGEGAEVTSETVLRALSNAMSGIVKGVADEAYTASIPETRSVRGDAITGIGGKIFGKGKNIFSSFDKIIEEGIIGIRKTLGAFQTREELDSSNVEITNEVQRGSNPLVNNEGVIANEIIPPKPPVILEEVVTEQESGKTSVEKLSTSEKLEEMKAKVDIEIEEQAEGSKKITSELEQLTEEYKRLKAQLGELETEGRQKDSVIAQLKARVSDVENEAKKITRVAENVSEVASGAEKVGRNVEKKTLDIASSSAGEISDKAKGFFKKNPKLAAGLVATGVLAGAFKIFNNSSPVVQLDIEEEMYRRGKGKLKRELNNYGINTNIRNFY